MNLGVSYIWIDSLCILQDDPQDWQCASAKMSSIFRGAILTISATTSSNSHEEIGINDTIQSATQFAGVTGVSPAFAIRGPDNVSSMSQIQQHMEAAPVNGRAWIFQEKKLSRRILHLTSTQFVWQCATRSESEDGFHLHVLGL
jgi:hypothetical protein